MKTLFCFGSILSACGIGLFLLLMTTEPIAAEAVAFQARTAQSGAWSDVRTWEKGRIPQAGDRVQVRARHTVAYDVHSNAALRFVHVAGKLTFSREKSTLLDVGLLKVEPGEETTEDGFDCHAPTPKLPADGTRPVLEIGTLVSPIPAGISATIRLRLHEGMAPKSLPAIVCCGGRWDVHGAPLARTWLKLAKPADTGDQHVTLEQPVNDWQVGDRIIITTDKAEGPGPYATFRKTGGRPKPVGTEERTVTAIDGARLTLDRPLEKTHLGFAGFRCEVANLSRNVVVESAQPTGVRGHTMYHYGSTGGISYAEFRHLGKDGVLGRYAIHFHLVRDTMRGSGVLGASIWDSHNRWITIHGTDHLLVRDCVGYQSLGHGYFLEDATEQWNVLDRNLAVQSFGTVPLPQQVLPFDPNDGAGFWWANGRNTFTRNVACENDRYGYHFQIAETPDFDPVLQIHQPDGQLALRDVRTIPFLRFEDNESHGEGLFDFRFGDELQGAVHGDREHPFILRNLRAWESHYVIRPNIRYFLLEGLHAKNASYGIYHPNYDRHVYRDLEFDNITAEPINGGHDGESFAQDDFTYEGLTFLNCRLQRYPLVQLTAIGAKPDIAAHFRDITLAESASSGGNVVDFTGGPRTNRTDNPITYYFHNIPKEGVTTNVASVKLPATESEGNYRVVDGWTGRDARVRDVENVSFPQLLSPIDDLPPATLITRVEAGSDRWIVSGVAHDNGEIAKVTVNDQPARLISQRSGVADWKITLNAPTNSRLIAKSIDQAGNQEQTTHDLVHSSAID